MSETGDGQAASGQADEYLPGPGIVGRNPCPSCARPPSYLCGRALDWESDRNYLVCFACNMVRMVKVGQEWEKVGNLPKRIRVRDF